MDVQEQVIEVMIEQSVAQEVVKLAGKVGAELAVVTKLAVVTVIELGVKAVVGAVTEAIVTQSNV